MKNLLLPLVMTLALNACQSTEQSYAIAPLPAASPASQTTWKMRFPALWESAYAGTEEPDPATVTYSQFVTAVAARLKADTGFTALVKGESGAKFTDWSDFFQLNCGFQNETDWECASAHATRMPLPFDPSTMASCEYRLDPGFTGVLQANVIEGSSTAPSRLMFFSPYVRVNGDLNYRLYQFEFWPGLVFQSLRTHAYYERKEWVIPGTHNTTATEFSSWGSIVSPGTLNGRLQIRCLSKPSLN